MTTVDTPLRERYGIVTGGARGIGAAIVQTLTDQGAHILVADILDDEGEKFAKTLGETAQYQHLDVTREQDWVNAIEVLENAFGPLSILINNAGIVEFGGIEDQSPESFREVVEVNLVGPWLGMHCAVPALRRAGGGIIVNISSTAGLVGYSGIGGYVASKWGLRGLTKAAALDLAQDKIRVCSVHPGPIHTPMTAGFDHALTDTQPIPRFGEPSEVAAMVRFLVAEATYSTGSEFVVDGGTIAGIPPARQTA